MKCHSVIWAEKLNRTFLVKFVVCWAVTPSVITITIQFAMYTRPWSLRRKRNTFYLFNFLLLTFDFHPYDLLNRISHVITLRPRFIVHTYNIMLLLLYRLNEHSQHALTSKPLWMLDITNIQRYVECYHTTYHHNNKMSICFSFHIRTLASTPASFSVFFSRSFIHAIIRLSVCLFVCSFFLPVKFPMIWHSFWYHLLTRDPFYHIFSFFFAMIEFANVTMR